MNYHYIKNKYEIVKYNFPDLFDIKIYYLNENYCQIIVQRLDSNEGWGLILQIKIFDIHNEEIFELINIGNSQENILNNCFYLKINLDYNNLNKNFMPNIIYPRKDILIKNNYNILKFDDKFIDFHSVIYKLNDNKIKIILRRLDEEYGWENDLKLIIYDIDNKNRMEMINLGSSKLNYKYLIKNTKIKIYNYSNDYYQEIPKIIFQTGSSNLFKNILHFNSIISFIELNPEYKYIYFTDLESRKFLKENFSEEINHSYDLLVPGAYKADLLRYCFLYHSGGCYFDCKQILKKPIRTFLENTKKLLLCNDVIEKALLNAVIFSIPKNIIIEKTIKDCVFNIINKLGTNALDITGPTFFYKSIKKYINEDNLLLQNNRPPNNFDDFCNDYYGNNIKLIKNNEIVLYRFYKGYYTDYLDKNHYGKLYALNEVYYKNFQKIGILTICIYPNKFNDKFNFTLNKDKQLNIQRIDSKEGWNFDLKILIIDDKFKEHLIDIGKSTNNSKNIYLKI
jgi:mannosyltransferase OCH1-like enzyme